MVYNVETKDEILKAIQTKAVKQYHALALFIVPYKDI